MSKKIAEKFEDRGSLFDRPVREFTRCESSDCNEYVQSPQRFCDECNDEMRLGMRSPGSGDPLTNYNPSHRRKVKDWDWDDGGRQVLPYLVLKDGTELEADLPGQALLHLDGTVYKRFDDEFAMTKFIRDNEDPAMKGDDEDDVGRHVFHWKSPVEPPNYTADERQAHEVFRYGTFSVLKMPSSADYLQREGVQMLHCLSYLHNDYAKRMQDGEIELYSLLDLRDNDPKVDIEVAMKRDSYRRNHDRPTVIQIRGKRNECPPQDEYILPLHHFFEAHGKGWNISGHDAPNFDGKVDGKLFKARVQALLQQESVQWACAKLIG